jgi:hypothetical protein
MTATRKSSIGIMMLSAVFACVTSVSLDAAAAKKKKKGAQSDAQATQVEAKDTSQTTAREHYNKGKVLYDEGKFTESLVEFQAAYDAKPHPTVLKSIAECQVQVGAVQDAIATLEKYASDPEAADKATVEKRIEELKAAPVKVSISSSLAGTQFTIAGKDGEFTAPLDVDLPPGEYAVTFSAEGYEPLKKSVTVVLGQKNELVADFSTEGVVVAAPEPAAETPAAEPQPPVPEGQDDSGPPAAFWAMAAVAGVGLISGTVFGTMALSMEDDYKTDPTPSKKESGQRDALIADVSFGVAAAAAIAGTVVFVVHKRKSKSPESAAVTVVPIASPNEFGVGASVRF